MPLWWRDTPAAAEASETPNVRAVVREPTLFAGIRKPLNKRAELEPRIERLRRACAGKIEGPLTHIYRFDTPVDGYDSEVGFSVSAEVSSEEVQTHLLRRMHFFSQLHGGPTDTLRETVGQLYLHMNKTGLSPELELVEVYHHRDPTDDSKSRTEVMASFLAWPEVFREQLTRVLDEQRAERIWAGGERLSPHTLVDERCAWVTESVARLKAHASEEQQYDILSRVALKRPFEEVLEFKSLYGREGRIEAVFEAKNAQLATTPTGGWLDPPRFDGKVLHMSKVARDRKAYDAATTHEQRRKAYCFCALVREAADPKIDPIFCYRAAGWDRQFWEPILGRQLDKCRITHSILKGDGFCAWDYDLT